MLAFGHAFQNIAFLALSANEGLLLTSGRPTISQKLLDIQPSSWQGHSIYILAIQPWTPEP